ncbi:hypothetical protein DYB36_000779 [Aphanomyces astaci]|uniref:Protein YIF1 n=2 Tax=Aphanomyces astaci TaxID=112090 RepID=A0A397AV18_APHAT|nr:hypothetical protein DYB36_000779 [Aphanomyces astaci]
MAAARLRRKKFADATDDIDDVCLYDIEFSGSGPIGIQFETDFYGNHAIVKAVVAGGAASKAIAQQDKPTCIVQAGHMVVAVNGKDVSNESFRAVMESIKATTGTSSRILRFLDPTVLALDQMNHHATDTLLNRNPMAAYAMNHGAKMMEDQVKSFMPGAAAGALNMFGSVKYYFTVNNTYVVHRLKMLLCPFIHKDWRRIVQNEGNNTGVDVVYAPPSMDKNAPDLYIPLMSFVTYILIVGYIKGASGRFNPDVITEVSTYCCLMQLVEICLMKLGLYLLNSQINWLDLVSFTGYKYVALVINTVVHLILGYIPYYVVLAYTGIATSFFTLNGLKGTVPEPNHDQRRFRNYMLLAYVSRFDF